MKNYNKKSKGFSLVEMLVAVALFSGVMLIGVGALLSLIDANRKAQAINSVMNNLNFAIESISRNVRVGTTYHCESNASPVPVNIDSTKNCKNGGKLLAFEASSGDPDDKNDQIVYRLNGSVLEKSENGGAAGTFVSIIAPEVSIEQFVFYVDGTSSSDDLQPRVVIIIQGTAGIDDKTKTEFNLQTTISQRVLDI
ncbi:prepilin-type N-terminal cleavage/methylation domain-containing protein [bacterium]|nr:prepilin-type N-terminal cleavage/methylation domain-containing protein [bacterium]MBT3729917.1 prepilin-type N-terminal cleavage/methylation domain-containing protein [bacterium]MBT4894883.1 prepilin-type N-terminal cleavage/methylation domain-containing protein [bacterium]